MRRITYVRVPMRCARTSVVSALLVRRGFGLYGEELFNRFCHGKFICLFILFLLLRGRVPLSLFRLYDLNFSVVVTCHRKKKAVARKIGSQLRLRLAGSHISYSPSVVDLSSPSSKFKF